MLTVTESNIYTQPFKNVREIVLTNTNSYKVTPSYSKNASIPVFVLSETQQKLGDRLSSSSSSKHQVNIDVSVVAGTAKEASELIQEALSLILVSKNTFDSVNQELTDYNMFQNHLDKNGSRLHVRTLVLQFYVD